MIEKDTFVNRMELVIRAIQQDPFKGIGSIKDI